MNILKKPYITAKSSKLNKKNKYCFIVDKRSNKSEIKKAVKKMYGVDIIHVNTILYTGKRIVRNTKKGLVKGRKKAYKKAILTLASGNKIDINTDAI